MIKEVTYSSIDISNMTVGDVYALLAYSYFGYEDHQDEDSACIAHILEGYMEQENPDCYTNGKSIVFKVNYYNEENYILKFFVTHDKLDDYSFAITTHISTKDSDEKEYIIQTLSWDMSDLSFLGFIQ